jgi:PAS domain S-box-containing protein
MALQHITTLSVVAYLAATSSVSAETERGSLSNYPSQAITSDLPAGPVRTISSLRSEAGAVGSNSTVRIQGTVLDGRLGEYIVVRDETGTIFAETRLTLVPKSQERVEVWGTPVWEGSLVRLENALFRPLESNEPAIPAAPRREKPAQLPVLTKASEIRDLSAEQAAWHYPVRLQAVVTVNPRIGRYFFVHDSTTGIAVLMNEVPKDVKPGDIVDIEGVSDPAGFAPVILGSNVTVVGTAPLPEPRQETLFQLATGQDGSQWIEVRGVVRSVAHRDGVARLQISDLTGTLTVLVPASQEPTNLLDSIVRIRGACGSRSNAKRQFTGFQMWASSLDEVQIEDAGAADPFSLPAQPVANLSQFRPRQTLQRRINIAGVVTACERGKSFFLEDGEEGVQVMTSPPDELKPGDYVMVAGYPALGEYGHVLRDAVFRVLNHGDVPEPQALMAERALDPRLHHKWIQIKARLSNATKIGSREVLTLQLGENIFEAHCLVPLAQAPSKGSMLQLTGVYRILADDARVPYSFQLIVPSVEDVYVLEKPSRWAYEHGVTIIGILALITGVTTLWVLMLRRRVHEQTANLQQSETKFRSLVEQSLVGVYIIQDERFPYVNPRQAEIFGYTSEEMMQSVSLEDTVVPEDLPLVREQIRRRMSDETKVVHYNFRGVRKDGSPVHVEVLGTLTEFDGQPAVLGTALDITERKRAEEELFNSRQMLRTMLDTIPQRVFWKDKNLVYIGCNKPFAEDCGYSDPTDLIGRTDYETRSIEIAEAYRADDQKVMESGVAQINYEEPQIKADGTQGWLRTSKVPLFGKDGTVTGLLGTYEDITDRKRAETELAEASTLLELMLENSPDYIYFKDKESRFVRCSKSLASMFRAPNETALIGKTDFDFFLEEHARAAFEDEQEMIRTGKPIIGKPEKETHSDGRMTWALTTKLPWYDKNGNAIGTFGISKDVTAIKEAEMKLDYERQLFKALVENFPDTIYFKDRESRFVRLSRSKIEKSRMILIDRYRAEHASENPDQLPAHLADFEKCSDYLIGKTDFDVYPEERARPSFEDEEQIIRTGEPLIAKLEKTPIENGKTGWYLSTKMPWRDQDGNIIGTFGVSRDVTALKEAEAQLESAHQRLVETSRLAGMAEVATDVLHNVGNVLNSVNVSCSLTIDRIKSSKVGSLTKVCALLDDNRSRLADFFTNDLRGQQVPDYLKALTEHLSSDQSSLLKEQEQLLKHVDHIKQIVAMQQSYAKVAGVKETIKPSQLVEDALHINAAALTRHDIQVERDFAETLPISTEKHKVLQILVNLIRNAKYAMDDSKRQDKLMRIKVGSDGNGCVKIQVIDNGVGIPEENLTRIFGHGFTTRRNGHGFGLHSSALAVKDLGGTLEVHSDGVGKGATFTLSLPCQPSNAPGEKL